jgi:hypothetical protein
MATGRATGSGQTDDHDQQPTPGQAVTVQLAVQGWATTHQPSSSTSPPDDPYDPAA